MSLNKVDGKHLAEGLTGIDSPRAWEMRERLLSVESDSTPEIAKSLAGIDTQQAWDMRDRIVAASVNFKDEYTLCHVASGLAGLDSERAWRFRQFLANLHVKDEFMIRSIIGDNETSPKMLCKNKIV